MLDRGLFETTPGTRRRQGTSSEPAESVPRIRRLGPLVLALGLAGCGGGASGGGEDTVPAATGSASGNGASWVRALPEAFTDAEQVGVESAAARGDIVIVAGSSQPDPDDEGDPAEWRSPDRGVTWTRVDDPDLGENGVLDRVVAGPGGFLAHRVIGEEGAPFVEALWFSADGTDWQRVAQDVLSEAHAVGPVAASDDAFLLTLTMRDSDTVSHVSTDGVT